MCAVGFSVDTFVLLWQKKRQEFWYREIHPSYTKAHSPFLFSHSPAKKGRETIGRWLFQLGCCCTCSYPNSIEKKSNSRNGISHVFRDGVMRLFSLNIERRSAQSKEIFGFFFFFFDLLIARVKSMLMCPRRGLVYNILIVRVHSGRNIRGRKVGKRGRHSGNTMTIRLVAGSCCLFSFSSIRWQWWRSINRRLCGWGY